MTTLFSDVAKEDLIYIAGLFDGEGCIIIGAEKDTPSYFLQVSVNNTNESLILWLKSLFGGYINVIHSKSINHKDVHHWVLLREQAEKFLLLILPYLKIKKPQAELAISFQENKGGRKGKPVSSDLIVVREMYKKAISALNQGDKNVIGDDVE